MFYRKNVGSKESWVRVIGFCPACAMAGRESLESPR
jgi:hypothetical protein